MMYVAVKTTVGDSAVIGDILGLTFSHVEIETRSDVEWYAYTVTDHATAFLAFKALQRAMPDMSHGSVALLEDLTKPPKIAPSGPRC